MSWIVVRNWSKFQHYPDRPLAWIKVYLELAHRDDWLDLTDAERGLLLLIWVEFALSNGQLRVDNLPARDRQKSRKRALERLSDAGFISIVASKPTRACAGARAKEKEKEKEPPKPPAEAGGRKRKERKTGYRFVRGTHSGTFVRDPEGTDMPPYAVPSEEAR